MSGTAPAGRLRRVALLGTGYIAEWHAKALATVPGTSLVAVCDQSLARAAAFAARFGIPAVHGSLEALLAAEQLDAVHVLLPPDLHAAATRTILEAGLNVLLEKPMCTRAEDAEELGSLATRRGLRLAVGHNFLFAEPYRRLREDLRAGRFGRLDHVAITWHRELPQITHGPFDAWMLRDPANLMLEIGSHAVAHLVDLVGAPDELRAWAGNPVTLPTGRTVFRRWQVDAIKGPTAIELRFSFVPGFDEQTIHVRGTLAAATVDFVRNTYVRLQHHPVGDDFDRHAIAVDQARALKTQARRTLAYYALSKLHLVSRGSPYGDSIAGTMDAFYGPPQQALEARVSAQSGAEVIRICAAIPAAAGLLVVAESATPAVPPPGADLPAARVLVLGATGFIGLELVRQLTRAGHRVRVLARSPSKLPLELRTPHVECIRGDLDREADLEQAFRGIDCVYHLARANVKSWADYQRFEVEATARVAECALAARVKRFVYTGTIDSYYAGAGAGTITEETPLDPAIERRNLYARAKAVSERLLQRLHAERGLPLVIMRPGIVIGRGGSPFHWGVGMWWHSSVCQLWGDGRNKLPLVLVEDVASALVSALDRPGLEGSTFNLVGDPLLSGQEYLDALDRAGSFQLQRQATPIWRFYLADLLKWVVKVLVRHPDRRVPSFRDWESRTQRATFDCSETRSRLGWCPVADREELIRKGIEEPLAELLR
jgi:nucleoside-diphosphate-sugar epimerase/predicted dehydrogenase